MNKVISVVLVCDSIDIANNIVNILLKKRMIAGSQINEIKSSYWWNNELYEKIEYKIDMKTILSLYKNIYDEVRKIHNYEIFELSYYEINANREFLDWVRNEVSELIKL